MIAKLISPDGRCDHTTTSRALYLVRPKFQKRPLDEIAIALLYNTIFTDATPRRARKQKSTFFCTLYDERPYMQKFTFSALFITDEDDESADKNSLFLHFYHGRRREHRKELTFSAHFMTNDLTCRNLLFLHSLSGYERRTELDSRIFTSERCKAICKRRYERRELSQKLTLVTLMR